jgi:hypothetical protein
MPHLKCLACKTRLHGTESQADPIGDLCPVCGSLLEPVGDLGEIVGYRLIEARGSTSHGGASGAGELMAASARSSLDASSSTHELGSKSKAATLILSAHKSKPLALALPARATARRDAAAALPPQPRRRECRASYKLSTTGVIGADGGAIREFARRLRRQATHRHEPV